MEPLQLIVLVCSFVFACSGTKWDSTGSGMRQAERTKVPQNRLSDPLCSGIQKDIISKFRGGDSYGDPKHTINLSCVDVRTLCDARNSAASVRVKDNNGPAPEGGDKKKDTTSNLERYGYGALLMTLLSACSLLGTFLLPCMTKNSWSQRWYFYVNTFMVSSAVSALLCDAIVLLVPEMFGAGHGMGTSNASSSLGSLRTGHDGSLNSGSLMTWKISMVVVGVYAFYLLEVLLHKVLGQEGHHSHNHRALGDESSSFVITTDSEVEFSESVADKANYLSTIDSMGDPAVWTSTGYIEKQKPKRGQAIKDACIHVLMAPFKWASTIKPLAWLIIIGDGLHNFTDGIALGVAFSDNFAVGLSTGLAMVIHEIPHELGDFAVLLSTGMKWTVALLLNFLHSLTAVVGFFIGIAIGTDASQATGWILGVTTGIFLYIALVDLLPSLLHSRRGGSQLLHFLVVNAGMVLSFLVLVLIALNEDTLNSILAVDS